jgi:threonine dehydrogenase-like Zn-dependent dehydrogenase
VVDASNAAHVPARMLDLVEPAGRVVYIGLAGRPSLLDSRMLALKDVTAVGVLSASPGLAATIDAYARGAVDPRPLVAATVGLDQVGAVLAGHRPIDAGPGPKIHVDPTQEGFSHA